MPPNQLTPPALRRLARYHARVEGAQHVVESAQATYRSLAENFETALRGACEDASIEMPPPGTQAQIHIDWNTGDVTWSEPQMQESPNGLVAEGFSQHG